MLVYRITKTIYADRLVASGGAARWNSRGQFVIYTAATRALACLENVVHRSGEGLLADFRVMVIDVPDTLPMEIISLENLPSDWFEFRQYDACQRIGGEWLRHGRSAVLKVPSAIIPNEWNFLLNPAHPDFTRITLLQTEPFAFDPRIKE
ncbi:RES domain-containing protein [Spirosoma sp. KCTC 42546]|uniref:RES family NAD+ phosphorylase n=1 Tax=Spirosoma sp. KCTC 42546 TaxID=2520506 RepID=UPI001159F246|nr:RES family NAD+ phosphorylase [Spirosoma sp. KCTC 42546]QDK80187.1 RES domain-containing protein [Spirosoma sp. KCTC 42546]